MILSPYAPPGHEFYLGLTILGIIATFFSHFRFPSRLSAFLSAIISILPFATEAIWAFSFSQALGNCGYTGAHGPQTIFLLIVRSFYLGLAATIFLLTLNLVCLWKTICANPCKSVDKP